MNQDIARQIESDLKAAGLLTQTESTKPVNLEAALLDLANTSQLLAAWEPTSSGFGKRFKIRAFAKIKAVVVNILSPYTRKQEQYNQILARAVVELLKQSK